jgi:hypothetical protein
MTGQSKVSHVHGSYEELALKSGNKWRIEGQSALQVRIELPLGTFCSRLEIQLLIAKPTLFGS